MVPIGFIKTMSCSFCMCYNLPRADAGFRKSFIDKFCHDLQYSIFQSCRLKNISVLRESIYFFACSQHKFISSPLSVTVLEFENFTLSTVNIFNIRQYRIRVFIIQQLQRQKTRELDNHRKRNNIQEIDVAGISVPSDPFHIFWRRSISLRSFLYGDTQPKRNLEVKAIYTRQA